MNCTTTKKIKLALLVYNSYNYLLLNFASLWSTFHSNLVISQLLLARLTSSMQNGTRKVELHHKCINELALKAAIE